MDRIGKGIRGAPRDALLAEGVPNESLGKVFGFHRAADTIGAVVGPLLGLAILTATGDDIGLALWIAVIPALISVALVGITRQTRPASSPADRRAGRQSRRPMPARRRSAPLPRRSAPWRRCWGCSRWSTSPMP